MKEVTFSSESHEYRIGGEIVPSVTQALKAEGLIDTRWYTPDARIFGTLVHEVLEAIDLGVVEPDAFTQVSPYIDAWAQFKDEYRLTIGAGSIEKIVYHEDLMYAGTLDRAGMIFGVKEYALIDIKTGRPEAWHGIQLAGYALAHSAFMAHPLQRSLLSVYLNRAGKYKVQTWGVDENLMLWKSVITLVNWRKGHGKRIDIPCVEETTDGENGRNAV